MVRMLKASFEVRLWPISNGNAVMTYVGFRSKIAKEAIIHQPRSPRLNLIVLDHSNLADNKTDDQGFQKPA